MERIFVDTSAWYAYVNRHDPEHGRVREVLESFEGRLVSSNFVFDETVTLIRNRLGHEIAAQVGITLLDADLIDLIRLTAADERAAWSLFLRRADKPYSFTDCTSFELMRRLGLARVAALDRDFAREGFQTLPPAAA